MSTTRILQRVESLQLSKKLPEFPKKYYVALDTETTGMTAGVDEVVQLSIICFTKIGKSLEPFYVQEYWREPTLPMSEAAAAYTGITPDQYEGRSFPDEVNEILCKARVLFAHNAKFDRGMLTPLYPCLCATQWGCTQNDIDWRKLKISSRALEFLLYKYGYFYDAHDASVDTCALFTLLQQDDNFKYIKKQATRDGYILTITGNTFANKEALKDIGLAFDYEKKAFFVVCSSAEIDAYVSATEGLHGVRRDVASYPSVRRYA